METSICAWRKNLHLVCGRASTYNSGSNLGEWIGFAASAIADGVEGAITIVGGVNASQTGLTVPRKYYLQPDGSIATTVVSGREVGRAISSTEILVTQGSVS